MSVSSQFLGGSSPIVTPAEYTSGAGTHTFNAAAKWYRYVVQAAGGGGGRPLNGSGAGAAGGGGGAGEYVSGFLPVTSASVTYEVGAAGVGATTAQTDGGAGGRSRLGNIVSQGGFGGSGANVNPALGGRGGGVDTGTAVVPSDGRVPGGGGGSSSSTGSAANHGGRGPGYPTPNPANTNDGTLVSSGATSPNGSFAAGGGSSPLGRGGDGNAAASGYGGGGGGGLGGPTSTNGQNGTGGYIRVEEFA